MYNFKYIFSFSSAQQMDFDILTDPTEDGIYYSLKRILNGNFMSGVSSMLIIDSY